MTRTARLLYPFGLMAGALLFAACSDGADAPAASRTSVVDSAGVRVVTNGVEGLPRRELRPEAEVSMGSFDGVDDALFNVRAVDRLPGGEWILANGGTNQIKVFTAAGEYLRSIGREGEGPGEFASLWSLSVFGGDSIFAWDTRSRRASVFSSDGELVRSVTPAAIEGQSLPAPVRMMATGSLLASGGFSLNSVDLGSEEIVRSSSLGHLLDSEGRHLRTLDEFGGTEQWLVQTDAFVSIRTVPFGKGSRLAGSADAIFAGATENPEIRVRNVDGELVQIWRLDRESPHVSPEEWEVTRQADIALARSAAALAMAEAFYSKVPIPARHPAWNQLMVTQEGELWMQQFDPPGGEDTNVWWRFDTQGVLYDEVSLPAGFDPLWISDDLVVGTIEDEFEVEYVRGYRIG